MWHPGKLDRDAVIYVAGHRGLVGSAVVRQLTARGHQGIVTRTSRDLDLRDRAHVRAFLAEVRPAVVIDAAARVGGIAANDSRPAEFLSDNLQIQLNLVDAAAAVGVPRLLFLGSSCIYPRDADQPIRESSLLTGPLERTNDAYAIAKIAGVIHVQAARRQYHLPWISAMPTNLYGPGDNTDPETSHVLPALIRRFCEAVDSGKDEVTVWGTGTPRRELLHVDDAAAAIILLLERYDGSEPVNVGCGEDLTIRELAGRVAAATGFAGRIRWDVSRPDGAPRKLLDVSILRSMGWQPLTGLDAGVRSTVAAFRDGRRLELVGAG